MSWGALHSRSLYHSRFHVLLTYIPLSLCSRPLLHYSIYAHGGWLVAGLLASSVAGVVCTVLSATSCQFVLVTYLSERGNFDSLFTSQGAGDSFEPFQTGAGLFSWLDPGDSNDWAEGTCKGYTQSIFDVIADPIFEAARVMSILSILIGLGVSAWILTLACISLGPKQVDLLAACQLLLTVMVSLTFLLMQSDLCSQVGQATSCQIQGGAMLAICAAISWFIGFLFTMCQMTSPEEERQLREEEIQRRAEALAMKSREKERQQEVAILEQEVMQQERQMMQQEMARAYGKESTPRPETPATVESGADDNLELDISESMNRIESLMKDEEDYEYI